MGCNFKGGYMSDVNFQQFQNQPIPKEILEKLMEFERSQKEWKGKYGEIRQPLSLDFHGYKMVISGSRVNYSPKWKFFPDFLLDYVPMTLGNEWGNNEMTKPFGERHQVVQWKIKVLEFMRQEQEKGRNEFGFYEVIPNGYLAAYMAFAYDLYVVHDNGRLDDELLRRLKLIDQFQGARHELFAEATCLRAGFSIEHENEKDRTIRHAEFTATHKETGQKVSVEAKSKHRPGVLGRTGNLEPENEVNLRFGSLLNDAIKKCPPYPLVIFLDTNLPPVVAEVIFKPESTNLPTPPILMQKLLDRIRKEHNGIDPFNFVVFSNYPHHYAKEDEADPRKHITSFLSQIPKKPVSHPSAILSIHTGASKYGNIPNEFPKKDG